MLNSDSEVVSVTPKHLNKRWKTKGTFLFSLAVLLYIVVGWVVFQKWIGFLSTDCNGISNWLLLIIYAFQGKGNRNVIPFSTCSQIYTMQKAFSKGNIDLSCSSSFCPFMNSSIIRPVLGVAEQDGHLRGGLCGPAQGKEGDHVEDRPGMGRQKLNRVRRASQVWVTHKRVHESKQGEDDSTSMWGKGSAQESQSPRGVILLSMCVWGGRR